MIARIRGPIDLNWIRNWADESALDQLVRRFSRYFKSEAGSRWYFFHDSFREFLVRKTSEFPPGNPDPTRDRTFHEDLADLCAAENWNIIWTWEEVYHRFRAGQIEEGLNLGSQDFFRRQFLSYRPTHAIQRDLHHAMDRAAGLQDALGLIRLLLANRELEQRQNSIQSTVIAPFAQLMCALNMERIAIEHVKEGSRLRCDAATALKVSTVLLERGLLTEARRIFELAEPLEFLSGDKSVDCDADDGPLEIMRNWARAATSFRPVLEVTGALRRVKCEEARSESSDDEATTAKLRLHLISHAGSALAEAGRWSDLADLAGEFDTSDDQETVALFWLHFRAYEHIDAERDQGLLLEQVSTMRAIRRESLGPAEITALSEAIFRSTDDPQEAKSVLEEIIQPNLRSDLNPFDEDLRPFDQRLRLNRLLYALGDRRNPSEIVPDSQNPIDSGIVMIERAICEVAHIWGRAWAGIYINADQVQILTRNLIQFFARSHEEIETTTEWVYVRQLRASFHSMLINAVSQHGPQAVSGLRELFEREWSANPSVWPAPVRRSAIMDLHRSGVGDDWARCQLHLLGDLHLEDLDVTGRVEECVQHASALSSVGDPERAKECLGRALKASFGVGYRKDYQLNQWVDWLGKVNEVEPDIALERIAKFASAVESLENTIESRPLMSAADRLLAVVWCAEPMAAIRLFSRFVEKGIVTFQSGLRSMLMEALKQADQPSGVWLLIFNEVLVPFDSDGDAEIAETLVSNWDRRLNRSDLIKGMVSLVERIRRFAPPSARGKWLLGFSKGLTNIGISPNSVGIDEVVAPPDVDEPYSSRILVLNDGARIFVDDPILSGLGCLDDLRALKERESEDSYFDWTPVVQTVVPDIQDDEALEELASMFDGKRESSKVFAIISGRFAELGDSGRAWNFAESALSESSNFGWGNWYDGGTRLGALSAMKQVDRERANRPIFSTIAEDFASYPYLLTLGGSALEDIIELTDSRDKTAEIWSEIEKYTDELFSAETDPQIQELIDVGSNDETSDAALIELTAGFLNHPCLPLVQAAQRVLGRLLLDGNADTMKTIDRFLTLTEECQERALDVIDAVSDRNPATVSRFECRVVELVGSADWSIRLKARSITDKCGWKFADHSQAVKPLPAIFDLTVLEESAVSKVAEPFATWIARVADLAGVPSSNLALHVRNKMDDIALVDHDWTDQVEEDMVRSLRRVGLAMPHSSIRHKVARRSLYHAIAELVDAHRVSDLDQVTLADNLSTSDSAMMLTIPLARPDLVAPNEWLDYDHDRLAWVANASASLKSTPSDAPDGRTLIAEATRLKESGNHFRPAERRLSLVGSHGHIANGHESDPDKFFATLFHTQTIRYPEAAPNAHPSILAVRNLHFGLDSPGADWLAFNPETARQLGWTFDSAGMFRWIDGQGEIMVETIWWTDGTYDFEPAGRGRYEVGDGWIVLASQAAVDQIVDTYGPLRRKSMVVRMLVDNSRPIKNSAFAVVPLG